MWSRPHPIARYLRYDVQLPKLLIQCYNNRSLLFGDVTVSQSTYILLLFSWDILDIKLLKRLWRIGVRREDSLSADAFDVVDDTALLNPLVASGSLFERMFETIQR